jgi:hypothetical protein
MPFISFQYELVGLILKRKIEDPYLSRNHWCVDCRCGKFPFQSSNDSFSYFNGDSFL